MRRREFLVGAGAAAAWASAGRAQQPRKIPRIGMLWANSVEAEASIGLVAAFHKGMSDLGYVDGRTMIAVERFADGDVPRLDELAAELVRLEVDLIAEGLAASLAHPGGNVTGNAVFFPEIMAKRVDLLKLVLPSLKRAGVLTPDDARDESVLRFTFGVMKETAKALGVELELLLASDQTTYESAFATASTKGIEGVVVLDPPIYFRDAGLIASLALKHLIPTGGAAIYARNGGLFGYGVIFPELWRTAAIFVDKILKGAKPGDIPFEQATRFETVVNLKTSDALGVTMPQTLLASASEVIE
jgi:putative ABC transport system substrate-binding protein